MSPHSPKGLDDSAQHLLRGYLFDCYADADGWVVWIVAEDGRRLRLIDDTWQPSFFLHGPRDALLQIAGQLERLRVPMCAEWTQRKELFYDREEDVLQVFVQRPLLYDRVVARLTRTLPERVQIFNCDFSLPAAYFFERRLFPMARVSAECRRVLTTALITAIDDPWDTDYPSPMDALRVLEMRWVGGAPNPRHAPRGQLELTYDGLTHILEPESTRGLIEDLNQTLDEYDPDVILTDFGDSFLFPKLHQLARATGVPLRLDRATGDSRSFRPAGARHYPRRAQATGRVRSYFQYGKMVYAPASHTLRGRWHVDRQNCFLWREGEWEGVLEVARIAKLPVQHMARTSVGRGIASMQLETLHREGYLVPWRKREPEDFKSADELVNADKGGLVFQPLVGWHENVAEIDFASMYPALMTANNISPETVNCRCCDGARAARWGRDQAAALRTGQAAWAPSVPELGYRICQRREGFVPKTLRPILEKRARYKQLRDESACRPAVSPTLPHPHPPTPASRGYTTDPTSKYDARQSALKWLLVVCFGYLGYKNARFGRIEAHESTTAWSREILLQAKEIAEELGFEMVHAIVDCVWVKPSSSLGKPGAARAPTRADYEALNRAIAARTNLPTTLEGVYRWLRFVPSVMNPRIGVPNRYFGVFDNGKTKVRGLALRKHDTPKFLRALQQRLIAHFAQARNIDEYQALLPLARAMVDEVLCDLRAGLMSYDDVAIFRSMSQAPEQYRVNSHLALAARELAARGVKLHAGEGIEYVVTDAKHRIPSWRAKAAAGIDDEWSYDVAFYEELTRRVCDEVGVALPSPSAR